MFAQITVIGNLGRDPEIRHLNGGGIAANFSVAVNEQWKDRESGETKQKTNWFNVVAYQQGETGLVTSLIQKYLFKGQLVMIVGTPQNRKWVTQQGEDRYAFEIKLGPQSTIKMLGGAPKRENGADESFDGRHRDPRGEPGEDREPGRPAARRQPAEQTDDDIPF